MRSSEDEKRYQIASLEAFQRNHEAECASALSRLQDVARARGNIFEELIESVKTASLGQISSALYAVGGEYRRNM
jgi:methylmalonyl-CoA mutase